MCTWGRVGGGPKSQPIADVIDGGHLRANIISSHCVLHECLCFMNEASRHGDAEIKVEALIYSSNFVLLCSTMCIFGIIIAFLSPTAVFAPYEKARASDCQCYEV